MKDLLEKPPPVQVEYFKDILRTIRDPLLVLYADLYVLAKPKETIGQLIYDLGNSQWDIPSLRALLETILPQKGCSMTTKWNMIFPASAGAPCS
jgi:hypothetical protein